MAIEEKKFTCRTCGSLKNFSEFYKRSADKPYLDCKACEKEKQNQYRQQNCTDIKARMYAWRESNKDVLTAKRNAQRAELNQKSRDAYYADVEKSRARARTNTAKYREKNRDAERVRNRERMRANYKKYYESGKHRWTEQRARRRAQEKKILWSDAAAIKNIYAAAQKMRESGIKCHVDHIVPLKSNIVCGLHVLENLVIVDAFDNWTKGNRYWPDMP